MASIPIPVSSSISTSSFVIEYSTTEYLTMDAFGELWEDEDYLSSSFQHKYVTPLASNAVVELDNQINLSAVMSHFHSRGIYILAYSNYENKKKKKRSGRSGDSAATTPVSARVTVGTCTAKLFGVSKAWIDNKEIYFLFEFTLLYDVASNKSECKCIYKCKYIQYMDSSEYAIEGHYGAV